MVSGQLRAPGRFTPGDSRSIGGRVPPRGGLDAVKKKQFWHAGNRTLTVLPADRRYIN
jgi:hypothetical protein